MGAAGGGRGAGRARTRLGGAQRAQAGSAGARTYLTLPFRGRRSNAE
jgi:hypothetical protein